MIHPSQISDTTEAQQVVVITDDRTKAASIIGGGGGRETIYVSTRWASAVLAEQTALPYRGYLLQPADTERCEATSGSQAPALSSVSDPAEGLPGEVEFANPLAVWQTRGISCTSDISVKRALLRSLPPNLCQRPTITPHIYPPPNLGLCDALDAVAKKRRLENAGGSEESADIRARAYKRASASLKCVPFELRTVQDVEALHTFGPRVLSIANEYIHIGRVKEADMLETDARLKSLAELQEIYGVGFASARKYFDSGIKTTEKLRQAVSQRPQDFPDMLVKYMRHYGDTSRMTISEARTYTNLVEEIANTPEDESLHVRTLLCGGFRRGEQTGHDVDILYCRRRSHRRDHTSVLETLTKRLQKAGILTEVLRLSSDTHGWGEIRYRREHSKSTFPYAHDILHAIAHYKGRKFRLDIVGIRDAKEFSFATLAWSGSTSFQRDIRHWIERHRGWIFNQHGLFDRVSGQRVHLDPFPQTEMDIFSAVGLIYRPPYERSC